MLVLRKIQEAARRKFADNPAKRAAYFIGDEQFGGERAQLEPKALYRYSFRIGIGEEAVAERRALPARGGSRAKGPLAARPLHVGDYFQSLEVRGGVISND